MTTPGCNEAFMKRGRVGHSPPGSTQQIATDGRDDDMVLTPETTQNKRKASPIGDMTNSKVKRTESLTELGSSEEEGPQNYEGNERQDVEKALKFLDELKETFENCVRGKKTITTTQSAWIRQSTEEVRRAILAINNELVSLKARNDERQELVKTVTEIVKGNKEKSYARIAGEPPRQKEGEVRGIKRGEIKTILIYPKKEGTTSEETRNIIHKKINPKTDKVKIHKISKIRDGGVAIEVENEEQAKVIAEKVKDKTTVKDPIRRLPKAIILGIPNDTQMEEVVERIKEEMEVLGEDQAGEIKACYKTGPKGKEVYNLVVEMKGKVHRELVSRGRLFLEWSSVKVSNYVPIVRCYRCQRFGHLAKICKAQNEICGHCSKSGHDRRNCPLTRLEPVCFNCPVTRNRHSVHSKECQAYLKERERIIKNTDYE